MSKRLHDSCIWEKKWFREFSPEEKLLFLYIKDRCDMSGVWEIDFDLASFYIGKKINSEVLNKLSKHIFIFNNGRKLVIVDFIFFQYGESLNPLSPVHKKVISILSKHKLSQKVLNTLSHRVCNTLLHRGKEEDKEEVKDKDKKEEVEKTEFEISFDEFCRMRSRIKKPLTDHAKNLILKKLNEISTDKNIQIKILDQSTANSWQGIFPINNNQSKGGSNGYSGNTAVRSIASEYDGI